jgi:peptidoglycan hydrolase-like protein with peptidoglycan-binding domain
MPGRRRTVLVVAGTAVVSILVGFLAASQVISPAESAARARPPAAEPVTVPVERRVIESRVVTRGDTSFDGAVEVVLPTGDLGAAAVVTGRVPESGATIEETGVLLEVVGRPVIALSGALPMYRSLRPGLRGPDVVQLEEVLARLGLDPGKVDDRYDSATGKAVAELFRRAGYEPPPVSPALLEQVDAAREAAAGANRAAAAARAALAAASSGPAESERLAAAAGVRAAERALGAAQAGGDPNAAAAAQEQLDIARAQEQELLAPKNTSAQRAALAAANRELSVARERLQDLQATVATPAPASEIVFLPSLPRRVDQVNVARGGIVDGPVMVVSGANLVVTAPVGEAERQLLKEQMPAVLEQGASTGVAGTVTAIVRAAEEDRGFEVQITPEQLSGEQVESLRDANVRVTIPVQSTDGEVLAVPLAALSAGPGGESRVELLGDDGETELVTVEVGLAAEGYAEIRPKDDGIKVGERVVVGR